MARWQKRRVFAYSRAGDRKIQNCARELAEWAGDSEEAPPEKLDAATIYAPVGALVPLALKAVRKGGRVVCAGIHMSDIPAFPYDLPLGRSGNLFRSPISHGRMGRFFPLVPEIGIKTHTTVYKLVEANQALADLRVGAFEGVAVLVP